MKRARFYTDGRHLEGVVAGDGLLHDEDGRSHREQDVVFLPPVEPRSVIAIALNYAEHAQEFAVQAPEEPALFFKPPNTWVGHKARVVYPKDTRYMHYEVELAVVMGRRCRRVRPESAYDVVAGYTIANDLVVRDFVKDFYRPPVKAKGWDTFCPLGPYLVENEIDDPHQLEMRAYVNGDLRQKGHTSHMNLPIPELIAYVTGFMTLEENDIILTGTPRGVSHVYPSDVMRLEIDGLGALENEVVSEPDYDQEGNEAWRKR